jgi:hypothetical protein
MQKKAGRMTAANISTLALRKAVLLANGWFLVLVGGAQMIFELLSHFSGIGPLGRIFAASPYTIGFFEAHGLAFLAGLLLIFAASAEPQRFWHAFALSLHLLLGAANLTFWQSFVIWELVAAGVVATALHGVFVVGHLACWILASRDND